MGISQVLFRIFCFSLLTSIAWSMTTPLSQSSRASTLSKIQVKFDRPFLNFNDTFVGANTTQYLHLKNTGSVEITPVQTYSSQDGFQSSSNCYGKLKTGESCSIKVDFQPSEPQKNYRGQILVILGREQFWIPLSGRSL